MVSGVTHNVGPYLRPKLVNVLADAGRFANCGSLAMSAAMRRASSRLHGLPEDFGLDVAKRGGGSIRREPTGSTARERVNVASVPKRPRNLGTFCRPNARLRPLIKSDDSHSTLFQQGVSLALEIEVTRQCSPN